MKNKEIPVIDSPLGKLEIDYTGSPVGVVRMDVNKSYFEIGLLLKEFIDTSDDDIWDQIKTKIDYTYENLDRALSVLEQETGFSNQIKKKMETGQKLLFKPNLVSPTNIDPQTHMPGGGSNACTDWAFIASLMRWFHDKLGISYYHMTLGEAATGIASTASLYSLINHDKNNNKITPEGVIEGKTGDFYGGWGFYFVRKYLKESLKEGDNEDPFRGYEESISGTYIPPGNVSDKLMVYDLNRIYDDPNKGRDCIVPDGVNYKSVHLHKVIVGGDPDDPDDLKAYPGSILVNVPKFKVHAIALFTNVIKNLGIGLYPMQYASKGDYKWDYSEPQGTTVVGLKAGIPHQRWVAELDNETSLPKTDADGNLIVKKTGGIPATMIDIIKAVDNQGIFMIHVVDGIEALNLDHQGNGLKMAEGMVFAGLDPVATDLLCSRYMFSNVPLKEALKVKLDGGLAGGFPQKVPIPVYDGKNIITTSGYDCPLARDICFNTAEKRGLGKTSYYVRGYDFLTSSPIISLKGHLGTMQNGNFSDIVTKTLFYDIFKVFWDLQRTILSYLSIVDEIEGTKLKDNLLSYFDEDEDGIVTYEEFGKKGNLSFSLYNLSDLLSLTGREKLGYLKGYFKVMGSSYKYSDIRNNTDNLDMLKETYLLSSCNMAFTISKMNMEIPDPFVPGLICGKGNWPSLKFAQQLQIGFMLYGQLYPTSIIFPSLYGEALYYADITQNGGQYAGKLRSHPDLGAITRYITDVSSDKSKLLDFVLYVPEGFDTFAGAPIPNVEISNDPAKILTASFQNGKEIWS